MSRYDSKVTKTQANGPEPRLCFGCTNSCFLVSCKGTCSLNCTVSTSSRPPVRKHLSSGLINEIAMYTWQFCCCIIN